MIGTASSTFTLSRGRAQPCWQDRGIVMRDCLGADPIDLRLVKASLDDRDLGVVRHQAFRHTAGRCKAGV
jgi:hypothetical protein